MQEEERGAELKGIKIGKYEITSYRKKSVLISKKDGESAEIKVKTMRKYLDELWKKEY